MKDVGRWLESADPLRTEPPLSATEVQRMRRVVVAAADGPTTRDSHSMQWVAAALVVAFVSAFALARWDPAANQTSDTASATVASIDASISTPRQLQFVTAGGTRVIWVFNPEFNAPGSIR
jgi:hypothetical protein